VGVVTDAAALTFLALLVLFAWAEWAGRRHDRRLRERRHRSGL
jgi:hypothetical protein